MKLEVRRVVTGHDENGKAVVTIDELSKNVIARRPGMESAVIWATDRPVPDLASDRDISAEVTGTTMPGGSVLRVARLEPGVSPRLHRTESIDYAIVLSGQLDMEIEDQVVHLNPGDIVVQRGTVHNWVNNGTEPVTVAFILISATMPEIGGRRLKPFG
jgi:quercetin dioxygenase-like cupin family protein